MSKSYLTSCPRCGSRSLECLETHSHCLNCLYSPDIYALEKRKYMTLEEAEALLKPATVREISKAGATKKESEVAS